jgi:two-component system, NarL family, nitrate/nitrite response regulator NarL
MQCREFIDEGIIDVVVADSTLIHSQLLSDAMQRDRRIRVVAAVSDSKDLFDLVASSQIHVAIVSSTLDQEQGRGFEVARELRQLCPGILVIMLLESSRRETVVEAFRAGAKGVFSTSEPLKFLCKSVRCVHQGQIWANATELDFALDALSTAPEVRAVDSNGIDLLSKREIEVVQCVAEGLTNGEIGERLGLSRHTIKNYLLRIFDKLGVSNRTELLFFTLSQQHIAGKDHSSQDSIESCRKAAEEGGLPSARLKLANHYGEGVGVTRDPVSAYMWCLLSERAHVEMTGQISRAKKNLADAMTPEQLREAEQKAAAWQNGGKPPIPLVPDQDKVRPFGKVAPAAMRGVLMS